MSRFFRLEAKHHNCIKWTLRQGEITPAVDDRTATQIEAFPTDFWTEVFKCQSCERYVEIEESQCLSCRSQVDMSQSVKDLLPILKQLKSDLGSDWDATRQQLCEKEEQGENRDTILNFLKE